MNNFKLGEFDNEPYYLRKPSFDCDWYIGFCYIGNNNIHTHLDHFLDENAPNKNMFDQMKEVFKDTLNEKLKDDSNLWQFCELIKTWLTLKKTYEIYNTGGSHYTSIKGFSLKSIGQSVKLMKDQIRVLDKLSKLIGLDNDIKFKKIERKIKFATKPTLFIKNGDKYNKIIYYSKYDSKPLEDYLKEGYTINK